MGRGIRFVLAVVASLLLAPRTTVACSCAEATYAERLAGNEVVFLAYIRGTLRSKRPLPWTDLRDAVFELGDRRGDEGVEYEGPAACARNR